MKRSILSLLMGLSACCMSAQELTATFNAQKVVLPSSQWTPAQTWTAQVMIFNTGQRYADANYNHVWGTPPADSEGRPWYAVDYALTNDAQQWQECRSPFSSDAVYLGQTSTRWITVDITGDIYLRRTFSLTEQPVGALFLACGHDDAPAEYYLNGVKVWTVTDGWNNDERVLLTDEQKALIHTDGTENLLAVHVHQNWGGAFADCGLYEADMAMTTQLLPTLQAGPWLCAYYLLNNNQQLNTIPIKEWAGICADEYDWIQGEGPLSNSPDQFRTTDWASERQPLLVRRHFTLTADEVEQAVEGTLVLTCSYDENPKVYLNGHLVWSASGWNDNDYARYTLTASQKRFLREGDNVLAVSLQSGFGGGHIDYGLFLTTPYVPAEPTEVSTVGSVQTNNGFVYNLAGQRISNSASTLHRSQLPHGVYVVGGKKMVVK
jgi:hypothetical protein